MKTETSTGNEETLVLQTSNGSAEDAGIPPHLLRLPDIGITLISPDYRLAPQAGIYSLLEDANSAVEYVRTDLPRLLNIDPSKLALTGGSAGGWLGTYYLIILAEIQPSWRVYLVI
jgi:acetyl esterase/lipase